MRSLRALSIGLAVLLAASGAIRPAVMAAQEREAVSVRGHWVIEVRNPDGTLAARREFDNALVPGGQALLAQYLAGVATPARWTVELGVYGGATSPCNGGTLNGSPTGSCFIVDKDSAPMPTGTAVFPTLTATRIGIPFSNFSFTGSATALVDGQIVYVATRQGACGGYVAPNNCTPAGMVLQFTVHDLTPAPLPVAAGQIVQVFVDLTFI